MSNLAHDHFAPELTSFPTELTSFPVDLTSLPTRKSNLAENALRWRDVWSDLIQAKLRFRSTLWANDRCVVFFHQSRVTVRQFALTERELAVFQSTLDGESQKGIAATRRLSSSTVGAALKSSLLKLGFPTHRHTAPIAALMWSHHEAHGNTTSSPPLYAVARGESILAATNFADWTRIPQLTSSELEIARLLIQGKPNEEIAWFRETSPHTVENQIASLLRKAGAANRFDLLRILYQPARLAS